MASPEQQQEALNKVKAKYGFVANIFKNFSINPAVTEFYMQGASILAKGELSPKEQQVVFLTSSKLNGCDYCLAAHGTAAKKSGLAIEDIGALQTGKTLQDTRLEGIRQLTASMVDKRGWLDESDTDRAKEAGLNDSEILEVIALVSLKTLTNYFNHIAKPEVDEVFKAGIVSQ